MSFLGSLRAIALCYWCFGMLMHVFCRRCNSNEVVNTPCGSCSLITVVWLVIFEANAKVSIRLVRRFLRWVDVANRMYIDHRLNPRCQVNCISFRSNCSDLVEGSRWFSLTYLLPGLLPCVSDVSECQCMCSVTEIVVMKSLVKQTGHAAWLGLHAL